MKIITNKDDSVLLIGLCADNMWWHTVSSANPNDDLLTVITTAKEKAVKELNYIQRKIDVYDAAIAHIRENEQ